MSKEMMLAFGTVMKDVNTYKMLYHIKNGERINGFHNKLKYDKELLLGYGIYGDCTNIYGTIDADIKPTNVSCLSGDITGMIIVDRIPSSPGAELKPSGNLNEIRLKKTPFKSKQLVFIHHEDYEFVFINNEEK